MENPPNATDSVPLKPSRCFLFVMVIVLSVQTLFVFMGYRLANTIILVSAFALCVLGIVKVNWSIVGLQSDLAQNSRLIVIAVFGLQTCITLALTFLLPEVGEHSMNRLPVDLDADWLEFLLTVGLVGPLFEELFYRGMVQEYLSRFVSDTQANLLTSAVFALAHWFPGPPFAIAVDLLFVFTSSLFFGLVYARTKNIGTSFVMHSGYNVYPVVLSLFLALFGH